VTECLTHDPSVKTIHALDLAATVIGTCKDLHEWLYSALLGPALYFSFVMSFTQTIGLLGLVITRLKDATYTQNNTNTE
jgi:hypothetical protein